MKPVFQTVFIATYLMQVDNSVVDFEDMLLAKKKRKQEMCTAAGYRQPPMCVNMNGGREAKNTGCTFAHNCISSPDTDICTRLHHFSKYWHFHAIA